MVVQVAERFAKMIDEAEYCGFFTDFLYDDPTYDLSDAMNFLLDAFPSAAVGPRRASSSLKERSFALSTRDRSTSMR
jgi:hypothetical protein